MLDKDLKKDESGYGLLKRISAKADDLWNTKWYFIAVFAAALVFLVLDKLVAGVMVLGCMTALTLMLCEDIMASALPFFMIFILAAPGYDNIKMFTADIPAAAAVVFAICVHFVRWHGKWHFGVPGRGRVLVAAATFLGGLDAIRERTAIQYYYILGLGAGLLLLYLLVSSQLTAARKYDLGEKCMSIMYALGLFMFAVVLVCYIKTFIADPQPFHFIDFKYRNYAATMLLVTCPIPVYFMRKNRLNGLVFLLFCAGLLLTGSRSAVLFGAIQIVLCCIYVWKNNIIKLRTLLIGGGLLMVLMGIVFFSSELSFILCRVPDGIFVSKSDHRYGDLIAAVKDFMSNPIVGTGIGRSLYTEMPSEWVYGSMMFYQNAPAQIIASMGIMGIVAYGVMLYDRTRMLVANLNPYNEMVALCYIGMLMVSMTNPGIFCPFPNAALMVFMFTVTERVDVKETKPMGLHSVAFGSFRSRMVG